MSKTSIELSRHALNGATMGTRWSALFFAEPAFDVATLQHALQFAVTQVDAQMSTWKPDSDLMRVNRAAVGEWIDAPPMLIEVLRLGLAIGRVSDGAFDIGLGDAVTAWGFGPEPAAADSIRIAVSTRRRPSSEVLEFEEGRLRKRSAVTLDLNGIAKGYGVDRLAATLKGLGIISFLVGIDGEMRASGLRPDGKPWSIAIEQPVYERRAAHSVLELQDAAIATSGDYRHWVEVKGRRLSHTMDRNRGAPLSTSPASVTVVARTCAEADAWATALMVLGPVAGARLAATNQIDALFLIRQDGDVIEATGVGSLFGAVSSESSELRGVAH